MKVAELLVRHIGELKFRHAAQELDHNKGLVRTW